jgi:hypothetical protein
MGLNWDIQAGTSRTIQAQSLNPDDSVPVGQFLSGDVVTGVLWQGSSLGPLLTKASTSTADVGWIDATNAQWYLTFHPADTAALPPAVYYLSVQASRGADVADLVGKGTTITLTAAPGTAAARATYVDVADLRRLFSTIDDLNAPGSETGFLDQCADAREWLEENILRNYGGGWISLLGEHGVALNSWNTGGSRRSSLRNPWILQLLAQGPAVANATGGLIVTRRTRDICAYYALYRILDGMITRGSQYAALAARMRATCCELLVSYTAELSVAGAVDQWGQLLAQIPINFSTARTLRV